MFYHGFQPYPLFFHPFSLVLRHFQVFDGKPMGAEWRVSKWNDSVYIWFFIVYTYIIYSQAPSKWLIFRILAYKILIEYGVGRLFYVFFCCMCVHSMAALLPLHGFCAALSWARRGAREWSWMGTLHIHVLTYMVPMDISIPNISGNAYHRCGDIRWILLKNAWSSPKHGSPLQDCEPYFHSLVVSNLKLFRI